MVVVIHHSRGLGLSGVLVGGRDGAVVPGPCGARYIEVGGLLATVSGGEALVLTGPSLVFGTTWQFACADALRLSLTCAGIWAAMRSRWAAAHTWKPTVRLSMVCPSTAIVIWRERNSCSTAESPPTPHDDFPEGSTGGVGAVPRAEELPQPTKREANPATARLAKSARPAPVAMILESAPSCTRTALARAA